MLPMRRERDPVQHAHQQRRDDKGQVHDDVPEQLVTGDVAEFHEGAQQVNRGDGHDGDGHLELQRAGIELAEPAELLAVGFDVELGDEVLS